MFVVSNKARDNLISDFEKSPLILDCEGPFTLDVKTDGAAAGVEATACCNRGMYLSYTI